MSRIRIRAAALLKNSRNELLLLQHQKEDRKYWVLPGGGVHYFEKVPRALQRELHEELNISVSVKDFLFMNESLYPDGSRHILNLYFEVKYLQGKIQLAEEERLAGYDFFPAEKLSDLLIFPALNQVLVDYLTHHRVCKQYLDVKWIS